MEEDKTKTCGLTRRQCVARVLDQGQGETCTVHALANAITQCLMDNYNVAIFPEEIVVALKQLDMVDILGGNHVQDFHGVILKNLMDHKTGAYGMVQVEICVPTRKTGRQGDQFVLVYDQVEGDPETKHCVYIQGVCSDKRTLKCINSWGPGKDERLLIKMDRPGNQVFRTFAKWIPVSQNIVLNFTRPQQSTNKAEILFLISVSAVTFFGKVVPLNFWMRKTVGI